jgi:UDP-N-acetylglucosamine 1-carboxyvinyltransferase
LYPADLVHVAVVLALKAKGNAMFRNAFYEYSFFFIEQLAKMRAIAVLADPTKVVTFGPTDFKAANMVCSDIIQASYALFIAALSAKGESTLLQCDSLFRRYPNIVEQFNKLGADVRIEK